MTPKVLFRMAANAAPAAPREIPCPRESVLELHHSSHRILCSRSPRLTSVSHLTSDLSRFPFASSCSRPHFSQPPPNPATKVTSRNNHHIPQPTSPPHSAQPSLHHRGCHRSPAAVANSLQPSLAHRNRHQIASAVTTSSQLSPNQINRHYILTVVTKSTQPSLHYRSCCQINLVVTTLLPSLPPQSKPPSNHRSRYYIPSRSSLGTFHFVTTSL